MIEPMILDGVTYDRETISELREDAIKLRDDLLAATHFCHAVTLSHTIALMSHLIKHTNENTKDPNG